MADLDSRHRVGGNNPPPSDLALMLTPSVVRDQLELDHAELFTRRDELLEGVKRFFADLKTIETPEQEARASDFGGQIKLLKADFESARKGEVKPLDDARAAIQKALKAESIDPLDGSARDIEAKLTVYQRAQKAKAEAEAAAERARLQKIADQAAAEAIASQRPSLFEEAAKLQKAADRGPAAVSLTGRGTASTVSLRTKFTFEEIDLEKVPPEWFKRVLDVDRIQAAIDDGMRDMPGVPAIPGLKIVDVSKSVIRA